ncbi:MAG TPA: methylated-DNA--[protein]-cysteine S-methyltransferase, partial [Stellaceae bacterium]|nr:methylated-DNA--[protein]-cysteine S-methyltransferase [Stellaceae bacterium]
MTALGDDRDGLVNALKQRFPAAAVMAEDAELKTWADQIVGFITAPDHHLDLPLDIQGTAFQARVWRALQKIPLGKTATYSEIAAAIGQPKAVRAVAQACATNRLALLVPCHRVIRSDGDIGGYRWGVQRKRALLAGERAAAQEPADEAVA